MSRSAAPAFHDILTSRLSRRGLLRAGLLAGASSLVPASIARAATPKPAFDFAEIPHGYDETHQLPEGYELQVLLRWGDPLFPDSPPFHPQAQTAAAQARQFGYNNDYIGFFPVPRSSTRSDHGLLCVNHEYTLAQQMFPGLTEEDYYARITDEQQRAEIEAHGVSVVEIIRENGAWRVLRDSPYNRRITGSSPVTFSGPAAGYALLQTSADQTGRSGRGTIANCAGGITPWGTYLTCEENFDEYFAGYDAGHEQAEAWKRYSLAEAPSHAWERVDARFDMAREPNEVNRFGWVVEIDPYQPDQPPIKRTALGRFKHESATCTLNHDNRVVVYSGDDEVFEYLYRYVSRAPYRPGSSTDTLLDDGVLSVAAFHADGWLEWIPLVYGQRGLTEKNGFSSQADVLIHARRAGDIVGATPMDRPEDVEVLKARGKVFVALTNNAKRSESDAVNRRAPNLYGYILELSAPSHAGMHDHAADRFRWDIFLQAGDPGNPEDQAIYDGEVSEHGWLTCPDNLALDPKGRLWVATDGMPKTKGLADGLYMCETEGPRYGIPRHFFRSPRGAEVTGPIFTPDASTLFISVQHPGDDDWATFDAPTTRWPDFDTALPPRAAVVAIRKKTGGPIGG